MPVTLDKGEATRLLAARAGLVPVDAGAGEALDTLLRSLPRVCNAGLVARDAAEIAQARRRLLAPRLERALPPPRYTNGRPRWFPERTGWEISPACEVLEVPSGVVLQLGRAPLVLADPHTLIQDFSSRYAPLAWGYDVDVPSLARHARHVAGVAVLLASDIHPLNYCHWLVDELPRLAALHAGCDATVVISDQHAAFRTEMLALCGVRAERVLALPDFCALRADVLLVTSDIRDMPHPGFKAAPWLLDFLRSRVGFPALVRQGGSREGPRLFVSRDDGIGRRVVNEAELMSVLAPAGYRRVTLAGRSVAEQVALFAGASHVVAAHGAGLANLVFAPADTRVLEIFPASYGMPSYYVLSAAQGFAYASYVAHDVVRRDRPQTDDLRVDIEDFRRCCGALL